MRDTKTILIAVLGLSTAFMAGMLAGRPGDALAQQAGGAAGTVSANNSWIAATGTVGSGMSVLWLVDTANERLLVYGTNSLGKTVELRAARKITWDRKLDEYHDESQYKADDLARLAEKRREAAAPVPPPPAPGAPGDAPK
jgi:hypothetical protein